MYDMCRVKVYDIVDLWRPRSHPDYDAQICLFGGAAQPNVRSQCNIRLCITHWEMAIQCKVHLGGRFRGEQSNWARDPLRNRQRRLHQYRSLFVRILSYFRDWYTYAVHLAQLRVKSMRVTNAKA